MKQSIVVRGTIILQRVSDAQDKDTIMDKWTELRETLQELHENNTDKPDVENVTRFLLNLMDVLDSKRNG